MNVSTHAAKSNFSVRRAVPTDVAAIGAIYEHYVMNTVITFEAEPPGREEWLERFAQANRLSIPMLVAEGESGLLGYAYCGLWRHRPAYRHTVEDSIYLDPLAVGQGIGTALLSELITEAAVAGMREIVAVIADAGNPASIALHRRCGFRDVGTLRGVGYKHDKWIDTFLMQRSL